MFLISKSSRGSKPLSCSLYCSFLLPSAPFSSSALKVRNTVHESCPQVSTPPQPQCSSGSLLPYNDNMFPNINLPCGFHDTCHCFYIYTIFVHHTGSRFLWLMPPQREEIHSLIYSHVPPERQQQQVSVGYLPHLSDCLFNTWLD